MLGFIPWAGKISWRREWQPTSVFFPGEFHGQRCQSYATALLQASILFDHPETCGQQPGHDAHWFPVRQTRLRKEARCCQGEAGGWGEPWTRARTRCGRAGPGAPTASSLAGFFFCCCCFFPLVLSCSFSSLLSATCSPSRLPSLWFLLTKHS